VQLLQSSVREIDALHDAKRCCLRWFCSKIEQRAERFPSVQGQRWRWLYVNNNEKMASQAVSLTMLTALSAVETL
jgi:hypothetical protein